MARPPRSLPLLLVCALTAVGMGTWYLALEQSWHLASAWTTTLNAVAVPLWGYDKLAARRGWRRIPELGLHAVALLGAVPASFLSMRLFRHKTLKPVFRRLYWTFLAVQVIGLALWVEPGLRPW